MDGLAVIVTIFIILLILMLIQFLYIEYREYIKKKKFVERLMDVENVPTELCESIFKVKQAHKRVVNNKKYVKNSNAGVLDNGRVKSVHMDDFYQLKRWVKRLEQARADPDKLYAEVDRIIREMNDRTGEYSALTDDERQELSELAHQPESLLKKYDENEQ